MKVAKVQFMPWDKACDFSSNGLELQVGDYVIVETELGMELGKILSFQEIEESEEEVKPIIRKALATDLEKIPDFKNKIEAIKVCREMVLKHKLEMKIVDVHFSFDDSKITFAFIADGRIDFRELVKDLTRHFNRTIRLHQIGIRDEAKINGDFGHCGRQLCCRKFLDDLVSITSEMAEHQQCVHRGSDRISGICGRLMCCLAYEEEGYQDLAKKMPPLGAKVNVDGRKGIVVGHHILKQTVDVEFEAEKGELAAGIAGHNSGKIILEIDLNRHKK